MAEVKCIRTAPAKEQRIFFFCKSFTSQNNNYKKTTNLLRRKCFKKSIYIGVFEKKKKKIRKLSWQLRNLLVDLLVCRCFFLTPGFSRWGPKRRCWRAQTFQGQPVNCYKPARFMAKIVRFDTTTLWLKGKLIGLNRHYEDVARLC